MVLYFKLFLSFHVWKAQNYVCGTIKVTVLAFLYLFSSKKVVFWTIFDPSRGHRIVNVWLLATKTKILKSLSIAKVVKICNGCSVIKKNCFNKLHFSDLQHNFDLFHVNLDPLGTHEKAIYGPLVKHANFSITRKFQAKKLVIRVKNGIIFLKN